MLSKCCNETLEESQFDPRIGECPRCGKQYTDREYKDILDSAIIQTRRTPGACCPDCNNSENEPCDFMKGSE